MELKVLVFTNMSLFAIIIARIFVFITQYSVAKVARRESELVI